MSINNDISKISYTNKDFNSIYTELLEYAKKLSYKWDPTSSDESDPGVVLLKLAAIIGDKDNYNIDKNTLELMPASVSQLPAAKQIFDQCGYTMHHYFSAEGNITVTVHKHIGADIEDPSKVDFRYVLPMFSMFTDTDNSVVYSTTEEATLQFKQRTPVSVIQGRVVDYAVNNDTLITLDTLDEKNRLYFDTVYVPENGIFITNYDSDKPTDTNYDEWDKVDILEIEPKNHKCYKFGLTLDSNVCYIEFPETISTLIGEGLHIKYVDTRGVDGNIAANKLTQFFTETTVDRIDNKGVYETKPVSATTGEVTITNPDEIINGKDPETIDEAYKAYKRVKNTFNTLVSVTDYTDYLVTSNSASNGYVTDRTNDIQHAYQILETSDFGSITETYVEPDENTWIYQGANLPATTDPMQFSHPDSLTAYDLVVYALEYVPTVSTEETFKRSFNLTNGQEYIKLLNDLSYDKIKSLQHNFKPFEDDKILMIKNRYPLKINIIPRYRLTLTERFQVEENIRTKLYQAINSKEITFGEEVSYDVIYTTVVNADPRIKAASVSYPVYETYAIYQHTVDGVAEIHEMRVDQGSYSGGYVNAVVSSAQTFNNLVSSPGLYYVDNDGIMQKVVAGTSYDASKQYFTMDEDLHDLWNNFRSEIFAKNILKGVTPLYSKDGSFTYSLNQTNINNYPEVTTITTETKIPLIYSAETNQLLPPSPLLKNESIVLAAPNFVEENNYSTYVKTIYQFGQDNNDTEHEPPSIGANARYALSSEDDFIIFFWKPSDTDNDYTYRKYDSSEKSPASIVSPNFELSKLQKRGVTKNNQTTYSNSIDPNMFAYFKDLPSYNGKTSSITRVTLTDGTTTTPTEYVKTLSSSTVTNLQVLTGTNVINTLKVDSERLNETSSVEVFWLLNKSNENNKFDITFKKDKPYYTLQTGEYFLSTNSQHTLLNIWGEGTKINYKTDSIEGETWSCPVISYQDIISKGIDAIPQWHTVKIKSTNTPYLELIVMQQKQLGPGNTLILEPKTNSTIEPSEYTQTIQLTNEFTSLSNYKISYRDEEDLITTIEDIDGQDGWQGKTILNLDISSNTPQKLVNDQSITFGTTTLSNCYVQSNETLNMLGGSNIDLTQVAGVSVRESIGFMSYEYSVPLTGTAESVIYDEDGNAIKIVLSTDTDTHSAVLSLSTASDSTNKIQNTKINFASLGFTEQQGFKASLFMLLPDGSESPLTGYVAFKFLSLPEDFPITWQPTESTMQSVELDKYYIYKLNDNTTQSGPLYPTSINNASYTVTWDKDEIHSALRADIYSYEGYTDSLTFSYTQDGTLHTCELKDANNTINLVTTRTAFGWTFGLQPGNYLSHITCDKETSAVKMTNEDATGQPVSYVSIDKLTTGNNQTFKISNTHTEDVNLSLALEFTLKEATDNVTFIIHPLYRYTTKLLDTIKSSYPGKTGVQTFEKLVIDRLSELDIHGKYNYVVDLETYISNPLEAQTFFYTDHFYNKYTIAEWTEQNSDGTDIQTTSNIK